MTTGTGADTPDTPDTSGPGPGPGAGSGTFAPRPGAAPLGRMILAQTALETRMLLRNGEQLLLTVIIPTLLLALFGTVEIVETGPGKAVDFLTPGVLALAVLSTAFTGQAIATGYERRYGVLKRLGASPLPRWALMTAKTGSVLVVEALQIALLTLVAFALGWSPQGLTTWPGVLTVALLLVLGTAAFSGLGLLMAGTLKAEATLAAANLVFILLLIGGGVIVPLEKFPEAAQSVLQVLPIAALSDGLRDVLRHGAPVPWGDLGILTAWSALGLGAAARFFRWE